MKFRTIKELVEWQPPDVPEYIGGGLLQPKGRMVIFGRWGTWKSMLAMHTGFCLATGKDWLGYPTIRCTTAVVQVEIPEPQYHDRVVKYLGDKTPPLNLHAASESHFRLDKSVHKSMLNSCLAIIKPKVLILDPFYKMFSGNIKDNYEIQVILDIIDGIAEAHNLAIILIAHTRKLDMLEDGQVRDWGQELIGGSYIMDWVDTAIALEQVADTDLTLHFVKTRHSKEEQKDLDVRVSRETLQWRRRLT